ncbi:MAG: hypothetical protein OXH20_03080 [bacterium]|nr:hypothetical protein [bacterium]MDE0667480.1 hypothetical protein [bacterium]
MSQAPPADLAELVSKFRQETGYPTEEDEEQKRLRDEWREKLLPENLGSISRIDLSAVTNESLYRNPKYVVPMEHESPFIKKDEGDTFMGLLRGAAPCHGH